MHICNTKYMKRDRDSKYTIIYYSISLETLTIQYVYLRIKKICTDFEREGNSLNFQDVINGHVERIYHFPG